MDIKSIRWQTPGCENRIHFNNAGAALVSERTLKVQLDYLRKEASVGGYETASNYANQIDQFYDNVADLIGAQPTEIAYTESATVAWLRAFWSINFNEGDEIICDTSSYASNYIAFLNLKQRTGVNIIVIDQTANGELDLLDLENKVTDKTKLISITHMPTNNGLVNPAEEIGKIAAKYNILYQLDACQSAGQYPIDVNKINCDFLSATGRKYLRGPRGSGFLFVKNSRIRHLQPLNLDLHSAEWMSENEFKAREDAKKFETWECNIAAKLGLSAAVEEANQIGIQKIWNRVTELADYMRKKLSSVPHITIQDYGKVMSGIVTVTSNKFTTEELKTKLQEDRINTTVAIKSGTLLDMNKRSLDAVLRVSVHYYNTKEEIDTFVGCIK